MYIKLWHKIVLLKARVKLPKCAGILFRNKILPFYVTILKIGSFKAKLLGEIIDLCRSMGLNIKTMILDKGFYSGDIIDALSLICTRCGEEVFDEEVSDQIEEVAKKKGLYGLATSTKIGVAGNSLDIRINKRLAEFLGLKRGDEVTVAPEGKNKLVVIAI